MAEIFQNYIHYICRVTYLQARICVGTCGI